MVERWNPFPSEPDSIDVVAASDYDALAARLAEEVENAATYKQERDEIYVNYETVAAKLSEAHRQNADLMAIIDKRDEALGFIPLDKGMDMQDELREVKARLVEAEVLIAKGLAVVHDFLPNIGRCVLQDYQRMNEFCCEAAARAADSAGEKP